MTADQRSADRAPSALRQEAGYQLELFALCGFAIVQPVLDVFGRNLEEFVFRGADTRDVIVFAALVLLVPWLIVGVVAAATRLGGATVRRWVQVVALGGLAGLVGLHVIKQTTSLRGLPLAVAAGALALAFAFAYDRIRWVGVWARYAAVAPVIFAALFLLSSPTSALVFPGEGRSGDVSGTKLPRHVVFLLFDELPTSSLLGEDGAIDAERFPNFARFASSASWHRNYTSVSGSTPYAVPALLTGRHPRDVTPTAASYPDNLFTLLASRYEVHTDEVITALCPPSESARDSDGAPVLKKLSGDAVDIWRQQVSLHDSKRQVAAGFVEEAERDASQAVDDVGTQGNAWDALTENVGSSPTRLNEFIDGIDARGQTVEFLHLLLPHQPWHYYPSGARYPFPSHDPGLRVFVTTEWGPEARPAELGRQRHLLQVQYVDNILGRVMTALQDRGIYDESLIVVTADHGISFVPGEEPRSVIAGDSVPALTYDQVMWTPLLIKAPHQTEGTVDDANLQSIDLLPTMADLMGITVPWKVDGVAASQPRAGDEKVFFRSATVGFRRVARGTRTTVDGRAGFERMLAGHAWVFAPTDDPKWAFYRTGPYRDLIGRRVDDLPTGTPATLEVTVEDTGAFRSVDPASGTVPGLLRGHVVAEPGATIAVAVNGTIAGISETFEDDDGPRRFAVMIPDFLFQRGNNDVRLFRVEGTTAAPSLHPLTVDALDRTVP